MKKISVIHCWSAPRSRSTALMYSFEARGSDCAALDEPLYRECLIQRGDAVARPYRNELINGTPPSGSTTDQVDVWVRELSSLEERIRLCAQRLPENGVVFCKHMAKHSFLYDFQEEFFADDLNIKLIHKHLFLIRDPVAVLSSWGASDSVHGSSATPDEVGIVPMLSIFSALCSRPHRVRSIVSFLDSDELVKDPERTLGSVCEDLGIPYKESMMSWPSGPHACDGPWASWWYSDVHQSTGWKRKTPDYGASRYRILNPDLMDALKVSYPAYEFLSKLTRGYQQRGPSTKTLYEDPRNEHLLTYIGAPGRGRIIPRSMAGVSPWDSSVQGGDAAWEGLRVYRGKVLSLDKHLQRLFKSSKALGFENVHTKAEVVEAIFRTLAANGMRDGAHMRLTLTRGEKCTSSMNPKFNVYGTTLIILAEWKPTEGATTYNNTSGIALISASQRRNSPQTVDSKIHHNNLINNILPKIQANLAGCDDAIMLDLEGFVSETNATNIFMVDNGVLLTPHADHCLPGITRATVLELAKEINIPTETRRISLAEFHAADEVFTTGTMGELTPVRMIDGRVIGIEGKRGPITAKLQKVYQSLPERPGWATEIPPFEA
jgi:branched-chain amino acid aminotransferase group I